MKYTAECTKWSGLSLRKPINRDIRDLIKDNKDSLVDFRSYLFSRQCALLFLLNKPLEVPKRAMEFLHNTVQEIRKLKVGWNNGEIVSISFRECTFILWFKGYRIFQLRNWNERLNFKTFFEYIVKVIIV